MSLRHAILGLLEYRPMHGYALKCVLEEGIANFWPVNLPAIYPSLRRLEEEGLVTHRFETTSRGRPDRKVYDVTDAGREELARWRRLPPEEEIPRFRNSLFLKLLFARRENLPDVREWVRAARERSEERAACARDRLEAEERMPLFVRFIRESGLAHLELHAERLAALEERVEELLARKSGAAPESPLAEVYGGEM
jgi:PadR family transcriptional regulator AphA